MNWIERGFAKTGIRCTMPFTWTGYTKMKDSLNLLDAIHLPLCRPEYQPSEGVTHCNGYVAEVCEIYGFKGLFDRTANEIIDTIAVNTEWSQLPIEKTQELANGGSLIMAVLKGNPHGHINIICPGKSKTSGRWGLVPSCANVGKDVFIGKGINWAFSDMPKFYVWRKTL